MRKAGLVAKLRRFAVQALENAVVGSDVLLSADESRHVRVLRLEVGDEIELFDSNGRVARTVIQSNDSAGVRVKCLSVEAAVINARVKLVLGVAWPKGKRAAVLVEKCAELGVDTLVPVQFERGVVSKDDESEGVVRLRRIAAEASKQSRRDGVMTISAEMTLRDFVTQSNGVGMTLVLDPYAPLHMVQFVEEMPETIAALSLLIGPEGGLTEKEIELSGQFQAVQVRMATHVLRIETAALAASAICRGILASRGR